MRKMGLLHVSGGKRQHGVEVPGAPRALRRFGCWCCTRSGMNVRRSAHRRNHGRDALHAQRQQHRPDETVFRETFHAALILIANAASIAVKASSIIAESASDQCMPIRLPTRPTVTPENARSPWLDMA